MAITLPDEYGYVLLAATSTFFVSSLHFYLTGTSRKAAGVKYPISYATNEQAEKDPKAYAFNCAQRAQTNFTENHPSLLGSLLIAGLKYPVYAATLGAVWTISRVVYAYGYSTKGPQGRIRGFIPSILSDLALKFMAGYAALGYALNW